MFTVYTIGHSNHSIELFIELLKTSDVSAVADVRSIPYSRRYPHFSKPELLSSLNTREIAYVFLGDQLGARPKSHKCYIDGKVDYSLIAKSEFFKEGLKRIEEGAQKFNVALMCAERDPIDCHRTILVARYLQDRGAEITHILANGESEPNCVTEKRLLKRMNLETGDLFGGPTNEREAIEEAYERRAKEISYIVDTESIVDSAAQS